MYMLPAKKNRNLILTSVSPGYKPPKNVLK